MDISIFIGGVAVLAGSIVGIAGVIVAFKFLLQDIHTKWFNFCAICTFVCAIILFLGFMIGSIVAISEQMGFASHSQVMFLLNLAYQPTLVIGSVTAIFIGIDLVNVHFEL